MVYNVIGGYDIRQSVASLPYKYMILWLLGTSIILNIISYE